MSTATIDAVSCRCVTCRKEVENADLGQEPPERTSDAERSGAGGRRVSALIWKKRVSKKRRAKIVELIQRTFPTAKDTGEAMELTLEDGGFRDVWLFMLVKEFSGIMAGGAERGAEKIRVDDNRLS